MAHHNMIPKQIFFIWIGKQLPDYSKYSMDSFKDMNPNFNIDLVYYSIDDFINCNNNLIIHCKDLVFQTKNRVKNKYFRYIKRRLDSKINFIQIISDVLRFELLYKYGGIYLDCDTFPIKQFDDNLLNMNSFSQNILCFLNKKYRIENLHDDKTEYYDLNFLNNIFDYRMYEYNDIYFVGVCKNYTDYDIKFTTNAQNKNPLNPPWIRNFENLKEFKEFCKKFYEMKLILHKDYFFYTQYIMHFPKRSWQNDYRESSMYCEYDDYLYKEEIGKLRDI